MSTLNDRAEPSELPRQLVAAFAAFGPAFMKWMTASARDSGVTYARMRALHVLKCNGPQIMSGLRDELGVTARSVTALVDALEGEHLVRRVPHPTDRRATIVEITGAGRQRMHGTMEAHAEHAAGLFARLDQHDQQELLRILRLLADELSSLGVPLGWGPAAGAADAGLDAVDASGPAGAPPLADVADV